MRAQRIAVVFLRTVGCLLIALGIVHLVATPHIPGLLHGSPRAVYQQAVGPTLLNHVLVGILLFPLASPRGWPRLGQKVAKSGLDAC
jgi:hypothetical protein